MIRGDLDLLLTDAHVSRMAQRKGYAPLIQEALNQLHLCTAEGIRWELVQHLAGPNSWSLWIEGNRIVMPRYRRPMDGTIHLYERDTWTPAARRKLVGEWRTPDEVADWFDGARIEAWKYQAQVTA